MTEYPIKPELLRQVIAQEKTADVAKQLAEVFTQDAAQTHAFNELDVPWLAREIFLEFIRQGREDPPEDKAREAKFLALTFLRVMTEGD